MGFVKYFEDNFEIMMERQISREKKSLDQKLYVSNYSITNTLIKPQKIETEKKNVGKLL